MHDGCCQDPAITVVPADPQHACSRGPQIVAAVSVATDETSAVVTARGELPAGVPEAVIAAGRHLAASWPRAGWMWGALADIAKRRARPLPPDLQEPLAQLGFDGWAAGEERVVFFHPSGWCLKVPRDTTCARANREEMARLATLDAADRKLFAESYLLPGQILLQRIYRVGTEHETAFLTEDVLKKQWEAQFRLGLRDIHTHNVGWTPNGGWVFVDWAGPPPNYYPPDYDAPDYY